MLPQRPKNKGANHDSYFDGSGQGQSTEARQERQGGPSSVARTRRLSPDQRAQVLRKGQSHRSRLKPFPTRTKGSSKMSSLTVSWNHQSVERWIDKVTYNFVKRHGGDFAELQAEAHGTFLEVMKTHDPERAKLTTWVDRKS